MLSPSSKQRFPRRSYVIVGLILVTVLIYLSISGNNNRSEGKLRLGSTFGVEGERDHDGYGLRDITDHRGTAQDILANDQKALDPCSMVEIAGGGLTPKKSVDTLVLVTGGAGFIGSNLVDRLLSLGYRVRIFDNLYTGYLRNVPLHNERVEFILGDIMDQEALVYAMKDVKFVYHLAAMSKVLPSLKDPEMALFCDKLNSDGTWNVLDAARSEGNVAKVVYAASSTYYGNNPPPHREDQAPDFLTPYAASKYKGELQVQMFDRLFGVPTISTRFFMVYGPRQPSTGAYAIVTGVFAKQAAEGQPLTIEGDGTHYRDFIHVDDIVTGLILAQQAAKVRDQTVNLGSGTMHSVKELADIVSPNQVHVDPRPNDLEGTLADTCKMKRLLGYEAKADFEENMRYMAQETMKGNAFIQPWLTTPLALSAPHLLPPGSPVLSWPKDTADLDALLLALSRNEANVTGQDKLGRRRITILPFASLHESERSTSEILLNTVFSLVRFGGSLSYIVAVLNEKALDICEKLNLPCLDVREQTHQRIIYSVLLRGYDVHYAQYGNSYLRSIDAIFDEFEDVDALVPNVMGDLFIRSNDETRRAFSSISTHGQNEEAQTSTLFSFSLPEGHSLSTQPYQVQHYCKKHWSLRAESQAGKNRLSRNWNEWRCSKDMYAAIGCAWDFALQQPNTTILRLKAEELWHLTSCQDEENCDLQQAVPLPWMMSPPDLKLYEGDEIC